MKDHEKISLLKHVSLCGYKSLADQNHPQKISFDRINIIIGANGSGKSNLVSFFNMLNMMMTGALQEFIGRQGSANSILHYGVKNTARIQAALEFENADFINTYAFSLIEASPDTLIFSREAVECSAKKGSQKRNVYDSGTKESSLFHSKIKSTHERIIYRILSSCRVYQFHDTSRESYIKRAGNIEEDRYLLSNGGNLAAYLYMLQSNEEFTSYYERIVSHIQLILPQFSDFDLAPQRMNSNYIMLNWREKNNTEYLFGPHQISDGSVRFMALATLLLQPPKLLPNIIVIDEPELGLHPEAIAVLASMIKIASQNAQVIIATQSPRLVDEFDPENIITAVHKDNRSIFKHLPEAELKKWLEEYSLSELWEKQMLDAMA